MYIKVAIADDHRLVNNGLQNILGNYKHIEVQAVYLTGTALLEGLAQLQPDVLLLDIQLPDKTGNELARIISKKYPKIKILALTNLDTPFHIKDMLEHGCLGYLVKNTDQQTLVQAIEQVYNGEQFLEPHLKEELLKSLSKNNTAKNISLSRREKQILELIVKEYTSQEIAEKLFISQRTVETHRFSLCQKLEVKNLVGLTKVAIQMGLVE
jgi:DNA-binding NarL/FixJ family response regulator